MLQQSGLTRANCFDDQPFNSFSEFIDVMSLTSQDLKNALDIPFVSNVHVISCFIEHEILAVLIDGVVC